MTRLKSSDIYLIDTTLDQYDRTLLKRTGQNLLGLACLACGVSQEELSPVVLRSPVAVVPITYGLGEIKGFAQMVKAIVSHLGFPAFVTKAKDIAGLAESYASQANILMLADDDSFLAINLTERRIIDNALATGMAYATALNQMSGGLSGKEVLVIGCGRVGESAASALVNLGAKVSVYDLEHKCAQKLAQKLSAGKGPDIKVVKNLEDAMVDHQLLLDASPAADLIQEHHITPHTFVAAPGVPHGVNPRALVKLGERFIHDPLQLGVATMAVGACALVDFGSTNRPTVE